MRLPLYNGCEKFRFQGGNAGLRYNKFADCWKPVETAKMLEFNPPDDPRPGFDWFGKTAAQVGDENLINEHLLRLHERVKRAGGVTIDLLNQDTRFVTGLGLEHPSQNGFAWHHLLGTPYLPGSGLKGAVRGYIHDCFEDHADYGDIFESDAKGEGAYIFSDLLPIRPVKLVEEVLTPHYGPYYKNAAVPGDWHSPIPIRFLAVDENQSWVCALIPVARRRNRASHSVKQVKELVQQALSTTGIGAKTQVGFGYFVPNNGFTKQIEKLSGSIGVDRADEKEDDEHIEKLRELAYLAMQQALELVEEEEIPEAEKRSKAFEFLCESATKFINGLEEPLSTRAAHYLRDEHIQVGKKNKNAWDKPESVSRIRGDLVRLVKEMMASES